MTERKHNHYFRPCPYKNIDPYRLISIYGIANPCAQHIFKKVLVTGKRGHKDIRRDINDIIDTAQRWLEMLDEDDELLVDAMLEVEDGNTKE